MRADLSNVEFTYPDAAQPVIAPCNLTLADGLFTCILGPSGGGKSTLLNLLAGLLTPTVGTITFDGNDTADWDVRRRNVGMVFQDYSLYPALNVAANIAFPLRLQHLSRDEQNQRVRDMADRLGIGDLLRKRPRHLSGGQQQRVALARALVKQPDLLLLDEPFSSLDTPLRMALLQEVRALQQDQHVTTVFVTHHQDEAQRVADQIVLLDRGQIQQVGTPQTLYHAPANLFTTRFIGQPRINCLTGADAQAAFGRVAATIGVRSEAIVMADHPQARWQLPATVLRQDEYGRDLQTTLTLCGETIVSTALPPLAPGALTVGILPDGIHAFAADGTRLPEGGGGDAD